MTDALPEDAPSGAPGSYPGLSQTNAAPQAPGAPQPLETPRGDYTPPSSYPSPLAGVTQPAVLPQLSSVASPPGAVPTPIDGKLIDGKPVKIEERPHPLSPLAKSWIALAAILYVVLREVPDLWYEFQDTGFVSFGSAGLILLLGVLGIIAVTLLVGYLNWRFTVFVIDDEELRIEHRFIFHSSDKVRFDRIQAVDIRQPFLARFLGLAALRIDVGGSGQAKSIEYLGRTRAYELRDYLISRAHGEKITVAESAQRRVGDAFTEITDDDVVIVSVQPDRLVISTLTSTEFLVSVVIMFAVIIGMLIWLPGAAKASAAAAIIPMAIGLFSILKTGLVDNWGFVLSQSGRGLRTSSGLTSITSQSLPVNRIQGVHISQSALWKPLGLYRARINILGSAVSSDDNNASSSSMLLPVGTLDEVVLALAHIWPGFDFRSIDLNPIPKKSRWFHPLVWKNTKWGLDDFATVTTGGFLIRTIGIVPHNRLQSVAWVEGPLQRKLGIADVQFHLPDGPMTISAAKNMDANQAKQLALTVNLRGREWRARQEAELALLNAPKPAELSWAKPIRSEAAFSPEDFVAEQSAASSYEVILEPDTNVSLGEQISHNLLP